MNNRDLDMFKLIEIEETKRSFQNENTFRQNSNQKYPEPNASPLSLVG